MNLFSTDPPCPRHRLRIKRLHSLRLRRPSPSNAAYTFPCESAPGGGPSLARSAAASPDTIQLLKSSTFSKVDFAFQRPASARSCRALVSRYLRPYCQLGGKKWPHWTLEATSSSLLFQPQNVGRCRMGPGTRTTTTSTRDAGHGTDAGYASFAGDTLVW